MQYSKFTHYFLLHQNNSASNLTVLSYTFLAKFAPCQKQSTNSDIFTMCSVSLSYLLWLLLPGNIITIKAFSQTFLRSWYDGHQLTWVFLRGSYELLTSNSLSVQLHYINSLSHRHNMTLVDILLVDYNATFYSATPAKFEMLHNHKKTVQNKLEFATLEWK